MLKMSASIVLSRSSPCNVPQGYASVAELPAALLDRLFEHPARDYPIVLEWGPLNFYRIHDGWSGNDGIARDKREERGS
jgi:hypothetical protein